MPSKRSSSSSKSPKAAASKARTKKAKPKTVSHALYTSSSGTAFANAKKNDLRRYPAPDGDGARLYPLVSPTVSPSFSIGKSDTVFAIGFCFARNLEGALHRAGLTVLSREPDPSEIGESVGAASNFLNKYTVPSILNELKWALERDSFPGEDIIYPISDGIYCDPQLGLVRLPYPLETIMQMRERYLETMAQVIEGVRAKGDIRPKTARALDRFHGADLENAAAKRVRSVFAREIDFFGYEPAP